MSPILIAWHSIIKKLTTNGAKGEQSLNMDISKAQDVQFAIPMRVREILGDKSGAVYGTIDTKDHAARASNAGAA